MTKTRAVAQDVHRLRTLIVNVYFVESRDGWVLIDAGVADAQSRIRDAAAKLFGHRRPAAILLTHGHFDHVGALPQLAEEWDVPIYVHPLELPYVTGRAKYPRANPAAGGGLMSLLSPLYPRGPYDFGSRVQVLPEAGQVPGLAGWRWIHTPGHTPGHVSFFRDSDRTLIAGDAVVTTKQESLVAALLQPRYVWRPPAYFTPDWLSARLSVEQLAALEPECLATGHGRVLRGAEMRQALDDLARHFEDIQPHARRVLRQPSMVHDRRAGLPARQGRGGWIGTAAAVAVAVAVAGVWIAVTARK